MELAEHIIKSEINSWGRESNDAKRGRGEPIMKFELNKDCVCFNLFATRNNTIICLFPFLNKTVGLT